MELLNGLNEAQRLAVTTTEGPVMVMAGAGAGKTKVLTTRISYIIEELGISPMSILAVTFTNKAANEMKERIANMIGIQTNKMWVSTFHSFCSRLLRIEIDALPPYTKSFTIIDEEDSLKIIKEIIKHADFDCKAKEIKSLISKSKNFTNFKINDPNIIDEYNYIRREYENRLQRENLLDFDDLIIKAIELFKKNPNILEKYQFKFQYILVDEFQDTNTLQYNLMFMLAARYHNIFVVGDDFQSIYSFRGAKIENINRFRNDFKEHQLIKLEKNYRSTTQILNLANCVIDKNPNQIKKVMTSNNKEGELPKYYRASSSYDEVMYVLDQIKRYKLKGYDYKDFAIMYRANYISRNFEDILVKYQMPYKIYGGLSFFSRKEIKDIIAFLRLIVDNNDDFSFKRIANIPKRGVGDGILNKLSTVAINKSLSLFDAIAFYTGKGQGANGLIDFRGIITSISAQIENVSLVDLIDMILKEANYEAELKSDMDTYDDRMQNIKEFKSVLKETDESYEGETNKEKLQALLSDLALRSENEEAKVDDSIVLTTYHQAKGLEFKVVFMVATEEGIFPSMNSFTPEEIEEERRICYVGLTRAKDHLYITCANNRFMFGSHQGMIPSRFIKEMKESLYENVSYGYKKPTPAPQAKPSTFKKPEKTQSSGGLSAGDKVNHKVFGDGVVISVNGNSAVIAFLAPHGLKTLLANHPSIRKL